MVNGHPTVETSLRTVLKYKSFGTSIPVSPDEQETFAQFKTDSFVFQGPKSFSFRVPLASDVEYVPITLIEQYTTMLSITLVSLSSLVSPVPTISYSVFVRAAENFRFVDPRSPSANAAYVQSFLYPQPVEMNPVQSVLRRGGVFKQIDTFKDLLNLWSGINYDQSMVGLQQYPSFHSTIYRGCKDYLAYLMDLFMYYRGSISYKVILSREVPNRPIVGVALGDPGYSITPTIPISSPFGPQLVPTFLDFGKGAVITSPTLQPNLEFTLPYRGSYSYGYTSMQNDQTFFLGNLSDPAVDTNASFIVLGATITFPDKCYRKVAKDFCFAVEAMPPNPTYWIS
jgi:hypothetical protein